MISEEISTKLENLLKAKQLAALVLGDHQNIQYATGVRIPVAAAQPDLIVLAVIRPGRQPVVIVPDAWVAVAAIHSYGAKVRGYGLETSPLEASVALMLREVGNGTAIGVCSGSMSARLAARIETSLPSALRYRFIAQFPCSESSAAFILAQGNTIGLAAVSTSSAGYRGDL